MKFKRFLAEETVQKLPPGFSQDDVDSLDDFYKESKPIKVKEDEVDDAEVTPVNVQKDIVDVKGGKESGQEIATKKSKLLHNSLIKGIIDDNGKEIDLEKLKTILTQRPTALLGQNDKLKKGTVDREFFDLTLPSYQGLYFDEKANEFKIVKTCPSAGECKKFCYAAKGGFIQYPAASTSVAKTITYLMNDYEGFKRQVITEIKMAMKRLAKKNKKAIIRWHDSGDFFSEKYLMLAFEVAKATPETLHYAYTKQVPMVKKMAAHKPENFVFNYSLGGLHDSEIDISKEKHARVVPRELFKDLPQEKTEEGIVFPPESIAELKKRVSEKMKIDINTIITYPEMLEIPEGNEPKYNVLVWSGHGDVAATRKDVIGTLLLYH
jgi:hypothetical protein